MTKSILITGSTDGIGKLVAIRLAKDGHQVFVHGRNKSKLDKVILEIKERSGNDNISGFVADFSDLKEVKEMAEAINNKLSKLDVLINNAGVFKSESAFTKDGLDLRITVNYLAPYLLTNEILPLLKKGEGGRIINLSSAAQATASLEGLKGNVELSNQSSYAQSKLALTMWSFDIAKRLKDISVIAVNPGSLLNTQMVKEAYGKHWSSADKGGDILYELAVSDEYKGMTGLYFDNDKGDPKGDFGEAHQDAYNSVLIKKLLDNTDRIIRDI